MARVQKAMCPSCTGRIEIGDSYCDHCGRPTVWASHQERIDWEVRQWRDARGRSGRVEVIEPRRAPSRRADAAVAEIDSRPEQPVAIAVLDEPAPVQPRESLLTGLRRLLARLRAFFNARIETSASAESADADPIEHVAPDPTARPTLVVVTEPDTEGPDTEEPAAESLETVVDTPAELEAVSEPPAAPAGAGATGRGPTAPRKRPNRPTNKELLQRALTTLERVEARLHHLEEEIDQAVRKGPSGPPAEDDEIEPPAAAGPFGYI